MIEKKSGKIINISSAAGKTGGVVVGAHYAASKAGLICLTKSLAQYVAPFGVNVNCVAPGIMGHVSLDTALASAAHDDTVWDARKTAGPQDTAEAVAFLCSDAARFVWGSTIRVG